MAEEYSGPTPTVLEQNMIAAPHLDEATHQQMRDDQEKMNHEVMAETAKWVPTPTVEEMNKVMTDMEKPPTTPPPTTPPGSGTTPQLGGTAGHPAAAHKVSEAESSGKEGAYKTREAKSSK